MGVKLQLVQLELPFSLLNVDLWNCEFVKNIRYENTYTSARSEFVIERICFGQASQEHFDLIGCFCIGCMNLNTISVNVFSIS